MGFDLKPRNKAAGMLHARGWTWLLEAGVGLPVCHGKGVEPAGYVFIRRPDGKSLCDNDGAKVTAKEAREMAKLARWVADYQDVLHEVYQRGTDEDKERWSDYRNRGLYHCPVRRDFVEFAREFADWAEKSGGFRVY